MAFVAQNGSHLRVVQNVRIQSERFVANDQHRRAVAHTLIGHELLQLLRGVLLGTSVDGQTVDIPAPSQTPCTNF